MPIYEYECPECGSGDELIRARKDADAPLLCWGCKGRMTRKPSIPYVRPEGMYVTDPDTGHRLIKNDCDDPWEGSGAENKMRQQAETWKEATHKQTKIQVDLGSKINVGANH